ncbi:zinc-dependent metalloprotease [Aquimarina agarivorans]|uniref:zinc-dependent metalloprotease n=1 Tax=Aquimarina agarivorans TaxID=980584 RepID=UPI001300C6BE|nr:zinc-dependent metalloprotease [Aquimarina agarivorans]
MVLNALKNSLQSVNKIFNRDLGIHLQLVENNEQLIFIDPVSDGLTNNDLKKLIYEAPQKIKSLIDQNSYDIAQTLGTFKGGTSSCSVAFSNRKANGITGHPIPEGKVFNIDYLAHEIAHQLGASHTQNSNCSRNSESAVEPGSGHTIMSYAGICNLPKSNVSNTSKPYFHSKSIEQISTYLSSKIATLPQQKNILMSIPNYSIPLNTPFEIALHTTIPSNKFLYFTCEQIDTEIGVFPPNKNAKVGPVFTSQFPKNDAVISFPKKELVINNNNASKQGVLAAVPRTYSFAASARSTDPENLGASIQKFEVAVTESPKFEVTSQNTKNLSWQSTNLEKITWNVGHTKAYPIHTKKVAILLSSDNGKTFQTLVKSTPNTGEATISVPANISSNQCRIKIKAIGNIFYALNTTPFSINQDVSIKKFTPNMSSLIKDKGIIEKTIVVDDHFTVENLEVALSLTHSKIGNLTISLENPSKQKILLWNRNCSNEQHIDLTFKDDEQKIPMDPLRLGNGVCDDKVMGLRAPHQSLIKLINSSPKGNWKLTIASTEAENLIILKDFNLKFTSINTPSIAKNQAEIKIAPNPAFAQLIVTTKNFNSDFTIEFYNTTGNLVKTISLTKSKTQTHPIDDLRSGLYLLKITNGKNNYHQKLVVK